MPRMNEMTAKDANNRFSQLLGAAWERLAATMDRMDEEASANNLTDAKLDALLANES